jgi:type II secretory pathway component PulK
MNHPNERRSQQQANSRRGVAALIALVCLSLATIIGTLLLQAALAEQRYFDRLELQSQGEWLVEAGFSRARAQLARSPNYSGETWTVAGSEFGRAHNATVHIAVRPDAPRATQPLNAAHVEIKATFDQAGQPALEASRVFAPR